MTVENVSSLRPPEVKLLPEVAAQPPPPKKRKMTTSGHCDLGHHEGTRPKSPSGVAFRTCEALDWCACECHAEIDKMFASAGRERLLISNPDYKSFERHWWMPTLEDKAEVLVQVAVHQLDGDTPPEFTPTETGRTARGQLEYWTKEAVEAWRKEKMEDQCTPKLIAELIALARGVTAPSLGAVRSVLMRWAEIEYAMVGKDPLRFIGLTPQGMKLGLDKCKALAQVKEGR